MEERSNAQARFFFLCQAKFLPWAGRAHSEGASGDQPSAENSRINQHCRDNRGQQKRDVEVDVIEKESYRARTTDLLLEIAPNGGRLFVSACWQAD